MEVLGKIFYPEQFNSKKIRIHPKFEEELKDILEKSGLKQRFVKMFRLRLKHLEQYWEMCVNKKDWFESLRRAPGLYSMRFKNGPKNIRIIFYFTIYEKRKIVLLVCAFEEEGSKDYVKGIEVSHERIEQVKHILE